MGAGMVIRTGGHAIDLDQSPGQALRIWSWSVSNKRLRASDGIRKRKSTKPPAIAATKNRELLIGMKRGKADGHSVSQSVSMS